MEHFRTYLSSNPQKLMYDQSNINLDFRFSKNLVGSLKNKYFKYYFSSNRDFSLMHLILPCYYYLYQYSLYCTNTTYFGISLRLALSSLLHENCPNTEFFLFHIFSHLDWIRRDTEYLSVFSPNSGKYGQEKTPYLETFHTLHDGSNSWEKPMVSVT